MCVTELRLSRTGDFCQREAVAGGFLKRELICIASWKPVLTISLLRWMLWKLAMGACSSTTQTVAYGTVTPTSVAQAAALRCLVKRFFRDVLLCSETWWLEPNAL